MGKSVFGKFRVSLYVLIQKNLKSYPDVSPRSNAPFAGTRGGAHLRKLQNGKTWRLRRDDAPAKWGGYNERKRDRRALRCGHVTPPSPGRRSRVAWSL